MMNMYELKRIIHHNVIISNNWTKHDLQVSNSVFNISDADMKILKNIEQENEYDYEKFPHILYLDCSPVYLSKKIHCDEFMKEYEQYINEKFFISFLYRRI